jgi:hypothetical protein
MTVIATFLLLISIIGWSSLIADTGKLTLPQAAFTVMAGMGCFMMMAFLAQIPNYAARVFIDGGLFAFPCALIFRKHSNGFMATINRYLRVFFIMAGLIGGLSLLVSGIQFGSIDDYSFWGTISRFLFVFNHLPENASLIKASFLQYTPGLACFHYLFYQMAGQYSPMLNYLAQDLILLAPLLLLFDEKYRWRSISYMMLVIITLYLAYGNILAKLEVDAAVALWFFPMIWVASRPNQISIWVMIVGLVFLSIIKEIGLLFSFFVLGVHYVCYRKQPGQLPRLFILSSALLLMKLAWLSHVHQFGFTSFAAKISVSNAISSMIPGNPDYVKSQIMFVKALLSSNFDHTIKLPFAALFILAGWQIHRLYRLGRLQSNHLVVIKAFYILLPFYILNLYWLQAIVFRVGYLQSHLLDFPRYFNMAFVPFLLSVLFVSLETKPFRNPEKVKRLATALSMIALVFIVGGKIERTKKYYHPFDFTNLAEKIQSQTQNLNQSKAICITHLPSPDYQVLLPLQYRLMPRQIIHVDSNNTKTCGKVFDFAELRGA